MAEPFPKAKQLARGERRYRRKVASPKGWQAIIDAKGDTCRICVSVDTRLRGMPIEYHHLVSRGQLGDDTADNIVPLCRIHHLAVTVRHPVALRALAECLTDGEYAYCIEKLGEGALERLFGVEYRP